MARRWRGAEPPWIQPSTLILPYNYYSTSFPLTENPISLGSIWVNGKTDGVDWQDVRTTPAKAFGTQSGSSSIIYDDSIAVLKGTFGADQEASAKVFSTDAGGAWNAEVEILLRFSITSHLAKGYEINYSCNANQTYCTIVRWNGAIGGFTTLQTQFPGTLHANDIVRGTVIGNTITGYINGVSVITATDSTYTTGNPGLGFYLKNTGGSGDSTAFGFVWYVAQTEGYISSPPGHRRVDPWYPAHRWAVIR